MKRMIGIIADAGKKAVEKAVSAGRDHRGVGVIEILLVLVVLVGLVLIFKNQIGAILTSAFNAINGNVDSIVN